MGKSESARECKRHPEHNHLPGFCPSCLRQRLLQLRQSSTSDAASSIHSLSSSSTSLSSSLPQSSEFLFSADSPRRPRHHHHHRRNTSEVATGSTGPDLLREKLKKSVSIGIEAGCYRAGGDGGKKKGGFWSRLLRPKASNFHSRPKVPGEIIG